MSEAVTDASATRSEAARARAAPPVLAAAGVTKRFGGVSAVDGVDVALASGEILSLVGPSGCGKSTLLRLLAGLERADHGTVTMGEQTVDGPRAWVAPEDRNAGVVFQDHALFPHLSVADNVAFGLIEADRRGHSRRRARRRGDASARRARLGEVLALVGLEQLAGRYPHELSGGEAQRVALARALAPAPDVILLDEPFSNLDRSLRGRVRDETVRVLRAAGAAALLVTHDQGEALATGDRLAVMRAGRVQQTDAPAAVFHAPATRFVATFMGEADFLPATPTGDGRLRTELGEVPADGLEADCGEGDADKAGLEVMVRPHEVVFEVDPAGDAVITDVEFQGAFVLHTLVLASGRRVRSLQPHTVEAQAATRVRARLDPGHAPAVLRGEQAVAGPRPRPGAPGGRRDPS
jgi:iron(III) transport system ATP-binding protein